jgi:hypothetical protein
MTVSVQALVTSQREAPEVCQEVLPSKFSGRRECRAPSAPAAACVVVVSTRVSQAGSPGILRANGFNGLVSVKGSGYRTSANSADRLALAAALCTNVALDLAQPHERSPGLRKLVVLRINREQRAERFPDIVA